MITHWDEVEAHRRERGHIAGSWQALTGYNSITVGVQRISVEAGRWATPLHLEGSEEEIFYVLAGTGFSFQVEGDDERVFPVGPGDCLVHRALEHAHTIGAGDDELVVLAFGQRQIDAIRFAFPKHTGRRRRVGGSGERREHPFLPCPFSG